MVGLTHVQIADEFDRRNANIVKMREALLSVSEQHDMGPNSGGDTVVPGFIMDMVREALK